MKASPSQQLKKLVKNNELELIHIMALPRSNGTALHIALTQAQVVSGQLNEPFYQPDHRAKRWNYIPATGEKLRSFEDGCQFILERYNEFSSDKKVTLIIHDHGKDFREEEFQKLISLTSFEIFVIREPLKHALSMLTRFSNEMLSQRGGSKLKTEDILQFMKSPAVFRLFIKENPDKFSLQLLAQLAGKEEEIGDSDYKIIYAKMIHIFLHEFETAWENSFHYYNEMKKTKSVRSRVFDSAWLFENPETHLQKLIDEIGTITFTPAMINDWKKGVGDDFHCVITRNFGEAAKYNPWNGPVRNSTGIKLQKESAGNVDLSPDQFPPEIQKSIVKMDKIYQMRLGS